MYRADIKNTISRRPSKAKTDKWGKHHVQRRVVIRVVSISSAAEWCGVIALSLDKGLESRGEPVVDANPG